jgi:broad specificity phosphatase PhoE
VTARLHLLRHGTTAAVRGAAFPLDEGLDERGRSELYALRPHLPARATVLRSPARRCAESAAALGHPDAPPDDGLREAAFGSWAGRSLADLHAEDPEPVVAWMTDPSFAPPGGESLEALTARVGAWMAAHAEDEEPLVAVTHGGVVRAAIAVALGAPAGAAWRIDVTPGSMTELHAHDGRWRMVRANWTPTRDEVRAARAVLAGSGDAGARQEAGAESGDAWTVGEDEGARGAGSGRPDAGARP